MAEDAVADIAEEDGREGEVRITEDDRPDDDDEDEPAGPRPGRPVQLLEARETDVADHQERDDQHEGEQAPGPIPDRDVQGAFRFHDLGKNQDQGGDHAGGGGRRQAHEVPAGGPFLVTRDERVGEHVEARQAHACAEKIDEGQQPGAEKS